MRVPPLTAQTAVLLQARVRAAALVQLAKAPVAAPEVQAVLDAAAAQEWAAAQGAAGLPVNTNGDLSVVALD